MTPIFVNIFPSKGIESSTDRFYRKAWFFLYLLRMSLSNALPADAAKAAKSASHRLATLSAASRNDALATIHGALISAKDDILAANTRDLIAARRAVDKGELSTSIVSRLDLGKKGKWEDMLKGILDVCQLEDPGQSVYEFLC